MSVSYTHLDVYKRQAIFFLTANLPAFAIFLVFLNFNDTLAADELLDIALDAFIPAFAPFPTYDPGT